MTYGNPKMMKQIARDLCGAVRIQVIRRDSDLKRLGTETIAFCREIFGHRGEWQCFCCGKGFGDRSQRPSGLVTVSSATNDQSGKLGYAFCGGCAGRTNKELATKLSTVLWPPGTTRLVGNHALHLDEVGRA
jgi:hypothetical protein